MRPTPALAFMKEVAQAGRNQGPAMLYEAWTSGRIAPEDLRRVVTSVWQVAEWPAGHLGAPAWVEMFRAAGFISDDEESQPSAPLVLYRGASWGRRRAMSWTKDREIAEWFAARYNLVGIVAHVFEATVPPTAVLALVGVGGGRNEGEVVVDPSLLPRLGRDSIVASFTPQ